MSIQTIDDLGGTPVRQLPQDGNISSTCSQSPAYAAGNVLAALLQVSAPSAAQRTLHLAGPPPAPNPRSVTGVLAAVSQLEDDSELGAPPLDGEDCFGDRSLILHAGGGQADLRQLAVLTAELQQALGEAANRSLVRTASMEQGLLDG